MMHEHAQYLHSRFYALFFRTREAVFALAIIYFPYFLPAIALRGPLRVRALVRVRWPRQGSPRR